MRRFIYIPILVAALLSMSSCENRELDYPTNDEWAPHYGYVQFSTDVFDGVSTRAALATDMRGRSFGVRSYLYDITTDWGAAKSTTAPSVFLNQQVNCGTSGVCTYDTDSGTTGNQLENWKTNIYTFFAYQPYGGEGITLSDESAVNTPTLTYAYDWIGDIGNTITVPGNDKIFDLMTAEAIDIDGRDAAGVNLEFNHRLFAIEVLANNYNEDSFECYYYCYVYETDEDGNYLLDDNGNKIIVLDEHNNPTYKLDEEGKRALYDTGDVVARDEKGEIIYILDENEEKIPIDATQTVTNLTLNISGLKYTAMTIPMSMAEGEADTTTQLYRDGDETTSGHFTQTSDRATLEGQTDPVHSIGGTKTIDGVTVPKGVTFQISETDKAVTVPAFNDTITDEDDGTVRGAGVASSISKLGSTNSDGYLMFIPQDANLMFEFDWDELDGIIANNTSDAQIQTSFTSDMNFQAGLLYQIIINFVGDGITIAIIEAGSWDQHNVYHTFE